METLPEEWLTQFETEEENPFLIDKMDTLDDLTPMQFAALFNEEYQNTFSTSSNANAFSSLFVPEESHICKETERLTKQLKRSSSESWSSGTTEQRSASSPELEPDVFSNGNSVGSVKSKARSANKNKKSAGKPSPRSSSCTLDHVIAERKRREKLTQQFIALSAMVPGLKKMDKSSVLGDCMTYIKHLQSRVETLEEQSTTKTMESAVLVKKFNVSSNTDDTSDDFSQEPLPEVAARISERNVLIKIHCEQRKGIIAHTLLATEQLNLSVSNSYVLPFGNSTFELTILAQAEVEFNFSVTDLVKKLHLSIAMFMRLFANMEAESNTMCCQFFSTSE